MGKYLVPFTSVEDTEVILLQFHYVYLVLPTNSSVDIICYFANIICSAS